MDSQIVAEKELLIKETFNLFDHDGDGRITKQQLGPALKELGVIQTEEELDDLQHQFAKKDHNKQGFIEYQTFHDFVAEKMPEDKDGVSALVEAFKVYNRSGNGLITAKELMHVLSSIGHQITEDEAREVLSEFDADSKGGITYEEFVQLAQSQ